MFRSSHVLQNLDVEYLYEAPLAMEQEHLAQVACECLNLPCPEPDLTDWTEYGGCPPSSDNRGAALLWLENIFSFTTLTYLWWKR